MGRILRGDFCLVVRGEACSYLKRSCSTSLFSYNGDKQGHSRGDFFEMKNLTVIVISAGALLAAFLLFWMGSLHPRATLFFGCALRGERIGQLKQSKISRKLNSSWE
jgi:hypothetical protein